MHNKISQHLLRINGIDEKNINIIVRKALAMVVDKNKISMQEIIRNALMVAYKDKFILKKDFRRFRRVV